MEDHHGKPWIFHVFFLWKFPGSVPKRLAALRGPAEMGHLHVRRRGVAIAVPGQMQTSGFSTWWAPVCGRFQAKKRVSFNHENCDLSNKKINFMMIYLIN